VERGVKNIHPAELHFGNRKFPSIRAGPYFRCHGGTYHPGSTKTGRMGTGNRIAFRQVSPDPGARAFYASSPGG
jgi:hypothetical protein